MTGDAGRRSAIITIARRDPARRTPQSFGCILGHYGLQSAKLTPAEQLDRYGCDYGLYLVPSPGREWPRRRALRATPGAERARAEARKGSEVLMALKTQLQRPSFHEV